MSYNDFLSLLQDETSSLTIYETNARNGTFTFKVSPQDETDNYSKKYAVIFSLLHFPNVVANANVANANIANNQQQYLQKNVDKNEFFIAVENDVDNFTGLKKYKVRKVTHDNNNRISGVKYYSSSVDDFKNEIDMLLKSDANPNILYIGHEDETNKNDMEKLLGMIYAKIEYKFINGMSNDDEEVFLTIIKALEKMDYKKSTFGLTLVKLNEKTGGGRVMRNKRMSKRSIAYSNMVEKSNRRKPITRKRQYKRK